MTCDNTHRLMYQYQSSPRMRSLILAITREYCSLEEAMLALETRLDIDLSSGVQLDLIGEIVGQPRPTSVSIDPDLVFGFDPLETDDPSFPTGYPPDYGWSGVSRPDRGGVWTSVSGLFTAKMSDADYRTLLRARIFANVSDSTVNSLARFLDFALGVGSNNIDNSHVGRVDFIVGRYVTSVEAQILRDLAPVAAGVRVNEIRVGV